MAEYIQRSYIRKMAMAGRVSTVYCADSAESELRRVWDG